MPANRFLKYTGRTWPKSRLQFLLASRKPTVLGHECLVLVLGVERLKVVTV